VFLAVANLLNLEVDLLFFDTTSTYFERDDEENGDDAFRRYSHSKDHRGDLPQIVIGLAVTKEGIPVRCWCWPGNSNDQAVLGEVRDDLRRLETRPGHHRRGPRVHVRGQPRLPAPRRRTGSPPPGAAPMCGSSVQCVAVLVGGALMMPHGGWPAGRDASAAQVSGRTNSRRFFNAGRGSLLSNAASQARSAGLNRTRCPSSWRCSTASWCRRARISAS
jgi:hypothetical protein